MTSHGKLGEDLAYEHKLPTAFAAKVDQGSKAIEISRTDGSRGAVKIAPESFASVANVLSKLWPRAEPTLAPGAALEITDTFTGKKVSVVASALPDVAAVLDGLVTLAGTHHTVPEEAGVAAPEKKNPKQVAADPVAPKIQESKVHMSESTAIIQDDIPEWFRTQQPDRLEADDMMGGKLVLTRTRLALEKAKSKKVIGRSKGNEEHFAWGYDVQAGGKHVAWVIAGENEKFVLTGLEIIDYDPSTHRVIDGLIARLTAIVLPKYMAAVA